MPPTSYYKDLFGRAPGNLFHLSPGTWGEHEKLFDEDNILLTRVFSEGEVKDALFGMVTFKYLSCHMCTIVRQAFKYISPSEFLCV